MKTGVVILFGILVIVSSVAPYSVLGENLEYAVRGPIIINSDDDFDSSHGVSGGSGIEDDPYQLDGGSGHSDNFPLAESAIPIPEFSPMVLGVLIVIAAILIRKKS